MKAADHVHFGNAEPKRILHRGDDFIERLLEGMRVAFARGESAELAGKNADVRVIDVTIENVGGVITVLALAHRRRHVAERIQVLRGVKLERVRIADSLACLHLVGDSTQLVRNECEIHQK